MWRAEDRRRRAAANLRLTIAACVVSAVTMACAYSPSPPGWLPTPAQTPSDVYGSWIVVTLSNDSTIAGEFLAYERDTVWVLRQDSVVRAENVTLLKNAQIWRYDSQVGHTAFLTLLGSLSTVSNGAFLIFTMPMWIITGTVTAAKDSKAPRIDPAHGGWDAARIHARYPAGLPRNLPAVLPVKIR